MRPAASRTGATTADRLKHVIKNKRGIDIAVLKVNGVNDRGGAPVWDLGRVASNRASVAAPARATHLTPIGDVVGRRQLVLGAKLVFRWPRAVAIGHVSA